MKEQRMAEVSGRIEKTDDDQRLVFGWANVAKTADGATVIDRQNDFWESVADLEETAYDYVLHSRDGGDTHLRKGVATLVESFVATPEKMAALGMPADSLPQGWWVGFKVHDDQVWKGVKEGKYTGFSIGGSGQRQKGVDPEGRIARDGSVRKDFTPVEPPPTPTTTPTVDPLLKALEYVAKHLPGGHNQKSHAGGFDPFGKAFDKAFASAVQDGNGMSFVLTDQNGKSVSIQSLPPTKADFKQDNRGSFYSFKTADGKSATVMLTNQGKFASASSGKQSFVATKGATISISGKKSEGSGLPSQDELSAMSGKAPTKKPAANKPSTKKPGKGDISGLNVDGTPLTDALKKINPEGTPEGTGTADDPIAVGDDLDKAVRLLSDGKHVRLRQPSEVATLLDKLAAEVQKAKDAGKDAPNIDLCKVSVPGTNLFCHDSKGIPRAQMPQFKGKARAGSRAGAKVNDDPDMEADVEPEFRAALDAMGIAVTDKTYAASRLRATQSELVGPKVAGMVSARLAGTFPDKPWDKPIYVTRDGYIIDGHHRWAAKVGVDAADGKLGDEKMNVYEVDMDIGTAIDFANAFALAMGITPKGTGADAEGVKKFVDEIRKARLRDTTPCFGCR